MSEPETPGSNFESAFKFESIRNVINLSQKDSLTEFATMYYHIFLWALFSSILIHVIASIIAFVTLRKHKFGRFFSIFILVMGFLSPLTLSILSSALIGFVHKASNIPMSPIYAMSWGLGQTILSVSLFSKHIYQSTTNYS